MFRNAHDQQIPKLSLGVQFDQEFMEKTLETSCCKLNRADCICSIIVIVLSVMVALSHFQFLYENTRLSNYLFTVSANGGGEYQAEDTQQLECQH